jgi:hypothetical protein
VPADAGPGDRAERRPRGGPLRFSGDVPSSTRSTGCRAVEEGSIPR